MAMSYDARDIRIVRGEPFAPDLEENLRRLHEAIPDGFWGALRAEGLVDPAAPVPPAGGPRG